MQGMCKLKSRSIIHMPSIVIEIGNNQEVALDPFQEEIMSSPHDIHIKINPKPMFELSIWTGELRYLPYAQFFLFGLNFGPTS